MGKDSFLLYRDQRDAICTLSDRDAGKLLKAVYHYVADGTEDRLPDAAAMAFLFIRNAIDRDSEKYAETCEKRRASGSKGGKKRQANANKCKQTEANQADNDNDSVPVPVPDNENDNDNVPGPDPDPVYYRGMDSETMLRSDVTRGDKRLSDMIRYGEERGIRSEIVVEFWVLNDAQDWMIRGERMRSWKMALSSYAKQYREHQEELNF